MAFTAVKATRIVRTGLGLLQADLLLPNFVWRDAGGDFAGAANDTINLKVPATALARTVALRQQGSGRQRVMDDLAEGSIPLQLTTDVYHGTSIDDEQMELDIEDFGAQILLPQTSAVARGIESAVAANMVGATYATTLTFADTDKPEDVFADARRDLNNAQIPMTDRYCVMGTDVENWVIKSDLLTAVNTSGSSETLREATIGRLRGFNSFVSFSLPPTSIFWFHRTAYVLAMRAPKVPRGASFGASQSYQGISMRWIMDYDADFSRDRSICNVYTGSNVIKDFALDDYDRSGPATLVRSVKGTMTVTP
jgi:hypothetical protein